MNFLILMKMISQLIFTKVPIIYEYNCLKPNLQEESSILQNFKSSLKAQYIN